jgi:hypothetical protein
MKFCQQLELFSLINHQKRVKIVLQAFPGSRVLKPEEAKFFNSPIHNEPEIQVQEVHKKPARGRANKAPKSAGGQAHEQMSFEFFDQVNSRGANDYQPPCKGEEKRLCNE